MLGRVSGPTGRILGGLATVVVVTGVVGSVVTLVTSVGPQEALVLLFGAAVLWLNSFVGIRAVSSTETPYW